jgi:hypothetical protein
MRYRFATYKRGFPVTDGVRLCRVGDLQLVLYGIRNAGSQNRPPRAIMLAYMAIAIGVYASNDILLRRRRNELV